MAITAPTYDPIPTAENLATASTSAARAMLNAQSKVASQTASALTTLSSALSAFDSVLSSLTTKKSVVTNAATFSSAVGTATATTAATPGTYSFFVEQIATAQQVRYNNLVDPLAPAGPAAAGAGKIQIKSGNDTFDVNLTAADTSGDGNLSVKELAAAINAAAGNDDFVTASTITIGGQTSLVLTANRTGVANQVEISSTESGSYSDALVDSNNAQQLVEAKNARIWLGEQGTGTEIEQASNTFDVLDGVSMTFTTVPPGGSTVSLKVGQDKAGTAANMQAFVDGWNKLIGVLGGLTSNGDASKEVAPAIFASDSGVTALQTRMEAMLRQKVGNFSLVSYGISANRDGTLSLNTSRLEKQLAVDPAGLDQLMGSASLSAPTGVMGGLDKLLNGWTNTTSGQIATRRESNSKLQSSLAEREVRITAQYDSAYSRYLKQFTALQELQSQMNSNSSLFDALFGEKSD